MSKIEFKKEVLDLVNQLTDFNPSIIFEKGEEDSIFVKRMDASKSVAYILSAADDSFNFKDEEIAFYSYPEFYQLLNVFEKPEITQKENKLIISQNNSKIKYMLSDPEPLTKGPPNVKFGKEDSSLKLTVDMLKEIRKMIGLVKAEKIELDVKKEKITIKCFNSSHDNSWENVYKLEKESKKEFNLIISSQVFIMLPDNKYILDIKEEGIVKFRLKTKLVNLEVFVAELDN